MAVLCEALSVLVPVETLMRLFPGGPAGYQQVVPNATLCSDGVLTRVGFMHPHDVAFWIERLEDLGFTFVRQQPDGTAQAVDIVVVDQLQGPTCQCDWLDTEVVDGVRWAWLTQYGKGELATPVGWKPGQSAEMVFHPNEEAAGMPIARGELMDETLNMETGATSFMARPFETERNYDEAIRSARQAHGTGDNRVAYQRVRQAEGFRELRDEDKYLAAQVCYELCLQGADDARALGPEAAQRWRELVDLDIPSDRGSALFHLARCEGFAGNWGESAACLEEAIDLDPEDAYALAERAFVAVVRREPPSVPAEYMPRALRAAADRQDQGAQAYIDSIMSWVNRRRSR